ncbi:HDOD domain-containing protein [Aliikangiella marina]|uniref:HDOD domain-containing protein n=1 Tax=Aliikangiella marina TaxID=1712262 RepID=A0A545TE29_9GAMM|nr:HDOD domain-containing protein [Aliikangiella marina]TQV75451.1 HDOD domain-containing protein [Aliikangiella marina]
MANPPKTKEQWLKLLQGSNLPSFSSSIDALSNADAYSQKHASELARTILKDANLTASVLKLANSVHFNTGGSAIRTISRALMVLGHKSVKEVCASCLLIDSFLKGNASDSLKALLARAFHSAIQAKKIAMMHGEKATEEIFISALLISLGEISVYSGLDSKSALFLELVNRYPLANGQEKELIGCYFNELTLGLCKTWNIAPMISQVISGNYDENSPLRSVLLGYSLASDCELVGYSKALDKHVKSIARYTKLAPEVITEKISEAADEAQKSLQQMGLKLEIKDLNPNSSGPQVPEREVNKELQLDIIQELTASYHETPEINAMLRQVLEGIHRGGNYSNALVALLSPDKSRFTAKHIISGEESDLKAKFEFNCFYDVPEIHRKVLSNKDVVLQEELRKEGMTYKKIIDKTGSPSAVWGPLIVENKVIGCFYADNGKDGPPVSLAQRETFQLFVTQARLFLLTL